MTAPAALVRDPAKVFIGSPDKSSTTVGEIMRAPLGTALPTDTGTAPNAAFKSAGYVSEDGLTFTPELSFTEIKDWNGDIVRKFLDSFAGTFAWAFLETGEQSQKAYWGTNNVTVTAATSTVGEKLAIRVNGSSSNRESWMFNLKDGTKQMRIVVPIGEITEREAISYNKSGALVYGVTLSTYADAAGNNAYVYVLGESPVVV